MLKALNKELKEAEELEKAGQKGSVLKLVKSEAFRDTYKDAALRVETTAKTQDEMLFSTKKMQIDGSISMSYEEAVNKVLDEIEQEDATKSINSSPKETI